MKRRKFILQSVKSVGAISLAHNFYIIPSLGKGRYSSSDTIGIGVIGCNGMGWSNTKSMLKPGVQVIALCDVDANVLSERNNNLEKLTGKKALLYSDYRKLLENKDIDAVIISTPDHWHALPMIHACELGKDVYVEKPLGRTIEECNVMLAAANKYQRIVQVGQWQRSHEHWQKAIDFVKSEQLGKIRTVKTWAYQGWMKNILPKNDSAVPSGVDYNMWLGPAPKRPFNENRFHFNFRWYWDYAGGLMTDWGVHIIDMALYGMGAQGPKSVMSLGGKFAYPNSAMETPDTQQTLYEFDGYTLIWEHANGIDGGPYQRDHGVAFIGNNGTLVVDRKGWEVIPEKTDGKPRMEAIPFINATGDGLDNHTQNFIECIKSRKKPNCDISTAQNTTLNASLGNIAYRANRKIFWDAEKQQIINDEDANNLTKANYQNGWTLPKI